MFQILVVDDDKNTRRLLRAVLEQNGYTVITAANGEDAMDQLAQHAVDLVVLDIMMPGMDGYTFTKECASSARVRRFGESPNPVEP